MQVNLKKISTEARNENTMNIDSLPTLEILRKINDEDKTVPIQIEKELHSIALLVDKLVECFNNSGRLIYVGCGTSGRIGVLDASEIPPTYGTDPSMVVGVIAGGSNALVNAIEGAEDDVLLAVHDLEKLQVSSNDFVVGIAASGRTPYVLSAMEYAKKQGAKTGCITTSKNSLLEKSVMFPVVIVSGAEVITGSTRMKSGTVQKLVCNMITTTAMIKLGKVYENLMVDLKATNEKLVSRMINIIVSITNYEEQEAKEKLNHFGSVKAVILAYLLDENDKVVINNLLDKYNGNIQNVLKGEQKCK